MTDVTDAAKGFATSAAQHLCSQANQPAAIRLLTDAFSRCERAGYDRAIADVTTGTAIEAAAKAHCAFFGGEGWWHAGLIADTKPRALEAMRRAITAAILAGERRKDA